MTVRDLLKSSLRQIGVIASSEEPTASELLDALQALNMMLKSWSANNLLTFKNAREVFKMDAGKFLYSMGVGGDFDTHKVSDIYALAVGNLRSEPIFETPEATPEDPNPDPVIVGYNHFVDSEDPISILDERDWTCVLQKQSSGGVAGARILKGSALDSIQVYPVPNKSQGIVIYAKKQLIACDDVNEDIDLPAEYLEAIKYNLAVRLAPEFGKEASPTVAALAAESMGDLKRSNNHTPLMRSDITMGHSFNILRGC